MTTTAETATPDKWTEYACTGCGATYSARPYASSPHQCAPASRADPRTATPCPPWCVTDHSKYSFHGSERITVEAPRFFRCSAGAVQFDYVAATPQVQVAGRAMLRVPSGDAGELADLIEGLAGATAAQLRQLAAAIRQAAADVIAGTAVEAAQAPADPDRWAFE